MIIAYIAFTIGLMCTIVWFTEFVPSLTQHRKHAKLTFWLYFLLTAGSAQYIWG